MQIKNKNNFWLILLGVLMCGLFANIIWTSQSIPVMVSLFGIAFGLSLLSVWVAIKAKQSTSSMMIIWSFAIGFRLMLLFSEPILEIDIYRYLWDGRVITTGESPYQYSPQQVRDAKLNKDHPASLQKLIALRDSSPAIKSILSRVHHEHLTTVYPPVSQVVFALAQSITPQSASVKTHLYVMKGIIILFDLMTMFLLIKILQLTSMSTGWVVTYAWSPLVLKEFANSGHLDSIAVCFTLAAIFFVIKFFYASSVTKNQQHNKKQTIIHITLAAMMLALAVGAKLYPVVLFPLFGMTIWRNVSLRSALLFGLIFFAVVIPIGWQMIPAQQPVAKIIFVEETVSIKQDAYEELMLPVPPGEKFRCLQHQN